MKSWEERTAFARRLLVPDFLRPCYNTQEQVMATGGMRVGVRWGRFLWRLGSGVWLGTIVFFFVGVAPTVFREAPPVAADRVITHVFPTYYAIGIGFGGAAMVGAGIVGWAARRMRAWVLAAGATVSFGLVVYAQSLLGVMNRLNPASSQFRALHQQSIVINSVIMLLLLALIIWEALAVEDER